MASRESSVLISVSGTFKTYPAGVAATSANNTLKNVSISLDPVKSAQLSAKTFNGHTVEVYADGAVWDTVSNKYLQPGVDFNPHDSQRK